MIDKKTNTMIAFTIIPQRLLFSFEDVAKIFLCVLSTSDVVPYLAYIVILQCCSIFNYFFLT